eukprot:11155690-Lingulodinium_polyedra.AAC.1
MRLELALARPLDDMETVGPGPTGDARAQEVQDARRHASASPEAIAASPHHRRAVKHGVDTGVDCARPNGHAGVSGDA